MASSHPDIQIRKTPVGKGVFAARQYRKRQVVGQMTGKIIADDNYDPDYVVDLGRVGVLEPAAPFRFLNHCCEPNAALIEYEPEPGKLPTMWVEVLRAIRPGDQITIDYGWPADSAIPCLCGAATCRGWVVAESELGKVKRRLAKEARSSKPRAKSGAKSSANSTAKPAGKTSKAARKNAKAKPEKPPAKRSVAANGKPKAKSAAAARSSKARSRFARGV